MVDIDDNGTVSSEELIKIINTNKVKWSKEMIKYTNALIIQPNHCLSYPIPNQLKLWQLIHWFPQSAWYHLRHSLHIIIFWEPSSFMHTLHTSLSNIDFICGKAFDKLSLFSSLSIPSYNFRTSFSFDVWLSYKASYFFKCRCLPQNSYITDEVFAFIKVN